MESHRQTHASLPNLQIFKTPNFLTHFLSPLSKLFSIKEKTGFRFSPGHFQLPALVSGLQFPASVYSLRKLSTGLAKAARIDFQPTAIKATKKDAANATINKPGPSSIR